jgi:hypothetical protein
MNPIAVRLVILRRWSLGCIVGLSETGRCREQATKKEQDLTGRFVLMNAPLPIQFKPTRKI